MKSRLTLIIVLLIVTISSAQNGINYKAVVKDGSGNILESSPVTLQFIIYDGAQTAIYEESHALNTDANGLVMANIGEGAVGDGDFSSIDWDSDDHYLNVQIDIGAGFVDLGVTQFKTVPYAMHANTAANVTGLEALDEGNGIGWRLKGRDPANHGTIGENAVDLSYSNAASNTKGATGDFSTAIGISATASGFASLALGGTTNASGNSSAAIGGFSTALGFHSTAIGDNAIASNDFSTAVGNGVFASGLASMALGFETIASGNSSTAMGASTRAHSYRETAMGSYNTGYTPASTSNWNPNDRLFVIGNGMSFDGQSNALTILKNGTITAPSFDLAEIIDDKALVTKEYVDNSHPSIPEAPSGLEAINEGNGIGWRLKKLGVNTYGNIGLRAVDLSYSPNTNSNRGATGNQSVAMGYWPHAVGDLSVAIGNGANATGFSAVSLGNTDADARWSVAVGAGNIGGGNPDAWVLTDPIFEVGNSNPGGAQPKSNALTILKNGKLGVGINQPSAHLHIEGQTSSTALITSTQGSRYAPDIILGAQSSANDDDEGVISTDPSAPNSDLWLMSHDAVIVRLDQNNTNSGNFEIRNGQNSTIFSMNESGDATLIGSLTQNSDKRLKKDVKDLPYGLSEILQLQPKSYNWKNREQNEKSLGLIAQEVKPIIKEIVKTQDNEEKTLGISYTELIPVLINAIKEQNKRIDDLESRLESQQVLSAEKD